MELLVLAPLLPVRLIIQHRIQYKYNFNASISFCVLGCFYFDKRLQMCIVDDFLTFQIKLKFNLETNCFILKEKNLAAKRLS